MFMGTNWIDEVAKTFFILFMILSTAVNVDCNSNKTINDDFAGSYTDVKNLQDSMLSSANYSTTIRPVLNQSKPLLVFVSFSLVAIVSVENVKQELVTNGFLFLFWKDERNSWYPQDYGGVDTLTPTPKDVWRPRLLLINTLGERDPFKDDQCHTFFRFDGVMGWIPGGLFHTYCALNMEKFPFDIQTCHIQLCPISHMNTTIQFVGDGVNLAFYYPNPGWELLNVEVIIKNISVVRGQSFSCPTFELKMKRRSSTIVLNVIIPVIMLSVLNNLVFLIPVDSGEKISYAITVLLALAVFLSMVSTMTPQVSDVVPALTIYLFVLLLLSVLTVAAAIFTVFLHHLDEQEECSNKEASEKSTKQMFPSKSSVSPMDPSPKNPQEDSTFPEDTPNTPGHNPYRRISKHINKFFFLLMNGLSVIMTLWYFIVANT